MQYHWTEGQWTEVPTDQTEHPSPRHTQAQARCLVAKEKTIAHSDHGAHAQMDNDRQRERGHATQACGTRQYAGGDHHWTGDKAADRSCKCSQEESMKEAQPSAFELAINRIRSDEQPCPNSIEGRVDAAQKNAVDDMPNQGSEQRVGAPKRPVQWLSQPERHDRQRSEEPPKHAVSQPPPHARSVSENIPLKQEAKRRSNNHGDDKVQSHAHIGRLGIHQSGNQREEVRLRHPLAEGPTPHNARQSPQNDGATQAVPGLNGCGAESQNAQSHSQRHSEANQVGDQFREASLSSAEHPHRMHRARGDRKNSSRNCEPQQKCVPKPPDQPRPGTFCPRPEQQRKNQTVSRAYKNTV